MRQGLLQVKLHNMQTRENPNQWSEASKRMDCSIVFRSPGVTAFMVLIKERSYAQDDTSLFHQHTSMR